ncbi:CRPV-248 [Crowpox virus]|nr:CRPV-248 [Crowpox virus]
MVIVSAYMQVKENNCMIMNPTTGELCHGENLLDKINSSKGSITKHIVTSNK